jgi:hypothetical protein
MKCKLLFILITLTSFQSFSQINKGQWLAGGGGVFSYSETANSGQYTNQKNVQTAINSGYFMLNNIAVGLNLNFAYVKNSDPVYGYGLTGDGLTSSTGGLAGPFVRTYLLSKQSKINFMFHGAYQYGVIKNNLSSRYFYYSPYSGNVTITNRESTSTNRTHNFMIAAGPVLFIHPTVSMELLVAYYMQKQESMDIRTHSFLTGIGFQIHLGKGTKSDKKSNQD